MAQCPVPSHPETIEQLADASIWLGWEIRTALIGCRLEAGSAPRSAQIGASQRAARGRRSPRARCALGRSGGAPRLPGSKSLCGTVPQTSRYTMEIYTGTFFFLPWEPTSVWIIELRSLNTDAERSWGRRAW